MRNNTVKKMAMTAMIAALYFALSLPFMTLIFGPVQLRIAEALTSCRYSQQTLLPDLPSAVCWSTPLVLPPELTSWDLLTLSLARQQLFSRDF